MLGSPCSTIVSIESILDSRRLILRWISWMRRVSSVVDVEVDELLGVRLCFGSSIGSPRTIFANLTSVPQITGIPTTMKTIEMGIKKGKMSLDMGTAWFRD